MPRAPGALWLPVSDADTQPAVRITQGIAHVAASEANSLRGYFSGPSHGVESHEYIRYDGTAEQYVDSSRSADANVTANLRRDGTGAYSIETAGLADGSWTQQQVDRLVADFRWLHQEHGVPIRVCPGPDEPGFGYHCMWGYNTRAQPHLNPWTLALGKVCPGPARVLQFRNVILPRVAGALPDEVADLNADQDRKLTAVYDMLHGAVGYGQRDFQGTVAAILGTAQAIVNRENAQDANLKALSGALGDTKAAVLATIAALPTAGLSAADQQHIADAVSADLAEQGVHIDVDELLRALGAKLVELPAPA